MKAYLIKTKEYYAWQTVLNSGLRRESARGNSDSSYHYRPWLSFEVFKRDMGECPTGRMLVRRDVSKPFSPSNCFWGTLSDRNSSRSATDCDRGKIIEALVLLSKGARPLHVSLDTGLNRQRVYRLINGDVDPKLRAVAHRVAALT